MPSTASLPSTARVNESRAASSPPVCPATSATDIDAPLALDDVETVQSQRAITGVLARIDVVLPAVPGADQVGLGFGEPLAQASLIRAEYRLDPSEDGPFADRSAAVRALVLESVEPVPVPEHHHRGRPDR